MARIPIPRSRVPAGATVNRRVTIAPRATARTFYDDDPAVGRQISRLGDAVGDIGVVVDRQRAIVRAEEERDQKEADFKRRKAELANAKAQNDPTPSLIEAQDGAAEDGSDLVERTRSALTGWIDETANTIEDDEVRQEYRNYWNNRTQAIMSETNVAARTMERDYLRQEANTSLDELMNRVRGNPAEYDSALDLGNEVLTTQPFLNTEKGRRAWEEQLGRARFDAMLDLSNTADEIDAVARELGAEDWQASLSPDDYDQLMRNVSAKRAQARRGATSVARSLVSEAEQRTNNLEPVSQGDIVAIQTQATGSGNASLVSRTLRMSRDQSILARHGKESPTTLRARAANARTDASTADVPVVVGEAVNAGVVQSQGNVTGSYLASVAQLESGGDPTATNPRSSATGMFGFTEATWLSVIRGAGTALVPDQAEKSDEELLAMRTDPQLSARATALLAERNGDYMRNALGREVTDMELYVAHFLGAPQGSAFIELYETNEDVEAAAYFPEAAKANPEVFYDGERAKTVEEMYGEMAVKFDTAPGHIDYGDADYLQKMAEESERRISENMMGYARQQGIAAVPSLDEQGGFEARADAVRVVSNTWQIPMNEMNPLEPHEVAHYANLLAGEDADAKLEVMAAFAQMGPQIAQQAYKQLGAKGEVYGHAAGLLLSGGDAAAAYDVVRGKTFIDQNPDYLKAMALDKSQFAASYGTMIQELVGQMGSDVASGSPWQTVLDASFSHYVQTYAREGNPGGPDDEAAQNSLNLVLGGTPTSNVIGTVNSTTTLLPRGVSSGSLQTWVDNAETEDWTGLSIRGVPPRYEDGTEVDMSTMRRAATFEAVGANNYRVKVDGQYLTTGEKNPIGRPILYVVRLNAETINARAEDVAETTAASLTAAEREIAASTIEGMSAAEFRRRVMEESGLESGVSRTRRRAQEIIEE